MAPDAASSCGAQPSCCLEPPLLSFDYSNSSSSTSGFFSSAASAGLLARELSPVLERSSCAGTSSSTSASSCSFDHSSAHHDRNCSSPDPIMSIPEEDFAAATHDLHEMGDLSQDPELEAKLSLDYTRSSYASFAADSAGNDDMFLSCLDKLFGCDSAQGALDKSDIPSTSDLFADSRTPLDSYLADETVPWPNVDNQQLSTAEDVQKVPSDEQENASQIFAQWLQSNSDWVSMSDFRKIKLKMSTVEHATKRLGGGRKGLMHFLKFVLMWIQNSKRNACAAKGASSPGGVPSDLTPSSGFMAATAASGECVSNVDAFATTVTPNVVVDAEAQMHASFPGCGSPPSSVPSSNWTASMGQGALTSSVQSIFSPLELGCYTPSTGCGAYDLLQSTSFYQPNSSWLHRGNHVVHGICPSTVSPMLQSPSAMLQSPTSSSKAHIQAPHGTDGGNSTMLTQQQQSAGSNLAATFRAARKNRMERQRWSVRHNRKWAAANQQRRPFAVERPNSCEHLNSASSSQSLGNGRESFSRVGPRLHQPLSNRTNSVDHQQSKSDWRDVKFLFHKQLKQSDVSLGKIVLPKAAETCLPPLDLRDGVKLVVEDMNSAKVWNMRYRFWPNNKSRMYLLENTSDFVRLNDLKEGDRMQMYSVSSRYMIRGIKAKGSQSAASVGSNIKCHAGDKRRQIFLEEEDIEDENEGEDGGEINLSSAITDEWNMEESCTDLSFVDLIEQSLEDL